MLVIMNLLFIAAVLVILFSVAHGQSVSAGACGPTSVANVPGCWGTPVCDISTHHKGSNSRILMLRRAVCIILLKT